MKKYFSILFFLSYVSFAFSQIDVNFSVSPDSGCAPITIVFNNLSVNSGSVTYTWDFGNGSPAVVSNDPIRQIVYDKGGKYTITLTVKNGNESKTISKTLKIFNPPDAQFKQTVQGCIPTDVLFDNTSARGDAAIIEYKWNFGDGKNIFGPSQTKNYVSPAIYDIFFKVTDSNGCTDEITKQLQVFSQPANSFNLDHDYSCTAPLTVTATLTGKVEPGVVYSWDFGDGNIVQSIAPDPYTYTTERLNIIRLTSQAGENCNSVIEKNVMVGHYATSFDIFYGSSSTPIANQQAIPKGILTFRNTSDGQRKYKWLVDGKTIINQDASDTFCVKGSFTATLIAGTDLPCPDTITKTFNIIDIDGSSIILNQDKGVVLGNACTGTFNFTSPFDLATNEWNFLSITKTGNFQSYLDCDTGKFTVTLKASFSPTCVMNLSRDLTVKDCNGSNIIIRNNGVDNQGDSLSLCTGDNLFYMGALLNNTPIWTLNGVSYNSNNPKVTICNVGTYTISLNGTYSSGCAVNATKTFTINKCITDNFKMTDVTSEITVKPNDTICFGNVLQLEPAKPSQFIKWINTVEDNDPLYFYKPTEGLNTISMVSTLPNGCVDTVSNPVLALRVIANFNFKNTTMACPFPVVTDLINISKNANWYKWVSTIYSKKDTLYRDTFSVAGSPIKTFFTKPYKEKDSLREWVDTNTIAVTLLAENKYGCVDKITKTLTKLMPLASFLPDKTWGCVTDQFTFEAREMPGYDFIDTLLKFNPDSGKNVPTAVYRFNEITHLYWDFGDGTKTQVDSTTLSNLLPNMKTCFTSASADPYDKAIIDKCIREQEGFGQIYCVERYLNNTNSTLWQSFLQCYTNAKTTSGRIAKHIYASPGVYNVTLVAEDENGCRDTSYQIKVRVGKLLNVDFTISPATLCPGDSLTLTGMGSDQALAQTWHYYSEAAHLNSSCSNNKDALWQTNPLDTGTFDVLLRASYNGCNTAIVKKNAIVMNGPVGQFSYPIDCANPYNYQFNGKIYGATDFQWDFGDSTIVKNDPNPLHIYKKSGNYIVTLTSTNASSGCKPYIYTKTINARKVKAVVDHDSLYCPILGLTLNAHSSIDYNNKNGVLRAGDYEPFIWFFNGKAYRRSWTDTLVYIPKSNAVIKVTLVALDTNRCTDTVRFDITPRFPNSSFTANKLSMCGPTDSIKFTYTGLDSTITQWRWSFGDSKWEVEDTSTMVVKTTHSYSIKSDKNFQVLFQVDNKYGCFNIDTINLEGLFHSAAFTVSPHTLCLNDIAHFNTITNLLDSSLWSLGDGTLTSTKFDSIQHSYAKDGTFPIQHIAYFKQCSDTAKDTVYRAYPDAKFKVNLPVVCTGKEVVFSVLNPLPLEKGTWNFPETNPFDYIDGTEYYSFYDAGKKHVSLTLNYGSCVDTSSIDLTVNGGILAVENPRACVGNEIRFYNNMAKVADSLFWDFGDGTDTTTISDSSVTHRYLDRKSYSVELISYKTGCNDTVYKHNLIKIQAVDAHFKVSDTTVCLYEDVLFTLPNPLDAIKGTWHFDSINATAFAPGDSMIKPYTRLGNVKAWLVVQSQNDCIDTAYQNISVNGALAAIEIPPDACKGQDITFKKDSLLNVSNFTWYFGDGDISQLDAPIHRYYTTGSLFAQLKIQDSTGCTRFISKPLNIIDIVSKIEVSNDTVCTGDSFTLINASKQAATNVLHFENGDSASITDSLPYSFNSLGKHNISMLATSKEGCIDSDTITLYVFSKPIVTIDAKDSICVGNVVKLIGNYNKTNTTNEWFINNYPYLHNKDSITDSPLQSVLYSFQVTDSIGCSSKVDKPIFVQQKASITFPLTDTIVAMGDTVIPKVNSNINSIFIWKSDTRDMSCFDCPNPKIYSFDTHDYLLSVKNWCFTDTFRLHIKVLPTCEFGVPKAFTPNGDGNNDIMRVRGWGIKNLIEFSIYNRWGERVFTSNDLSTGWDGFFNGRPQPIETYAYIIVVETYLEPRVTKKGYFDLIR
jgi:gliding motility-associated-like protein